jgi:hypothetical protein
MKTAQQKYIYKTQCKKWNETEKGLLFVDVN